MTKEEFVAERIHEELFLEIATPISDPERLGWRHDVTASGTVVSQKKGTHRDKSQHEGPPSVLPANVLDVEPLKSQTIEKGWGLRFGR